MARPSTPFRGRTPQRAVFPDAPFNAPSGSRSSSVSSVRSMIDERLEWAHHERLRSASREPPLPPSPFYESSPFYSEFVRNYRSPYEPPPFYICECCERPRCFSTMAELRSHESEKKYANAASASPPENDAEDQVESPRQRRYIWSCAAVTNPADAFYRSGAGDIFCKCCQRRFCGFERKQVLSQHLSSAHEFGKCNEVTDFFRTDHFYQHLKHSHGCSDEMGMWSLGDACKSVYYCNEPLSSPEVQIEPTGTGVTIEALSSHRGRKRHLSGSRAGQTRLRQHTPFVPVASPVPAEIPLSTGCPTSQGDISMRVSSTKACVDCRRNESQCDGLEHCGQCKRSGISSKDCVYMYEDRAQWRIVSQTQSPPDRQQQQTGAIQSSQGRESSTSTAPSPSPIPPSETTKPQTPFVCHICQQCFTRSTSLRIHQRAHTGEKPFSCGVPGCNQIFTQQGDRSRHEQAQHGEKNHVCGGKGIAGSSWGCGKAFGRKDGLLEHHRKTVKGRKCIAARDRIKDSEGI